MNNIDQIQLWNEEITAERFLNFLEKYFVDIEEFNSLVIEKSQDELSFSLNKIFKTEIEDLELEYLKIIQLKPIILPAFYVFWHHYIPR